jgi:hypothetical protein
MRPFVRTSYTLLALAVASLAPRAALADEGGTREAAKHFQRGVMLYGEADYRAALVEFKRAYAIAPNVAVLYNVAEAEYQLYDYANALVTFERYLAETSASDGRRAEVEGNIEVLRSRVGHLSIATVPAGADVTLDDQALAKTSLDKPVLVSIGRRKLVASMAGRPPVTRYVDVAADDNMSVTLQLPPLADAPPAPVVSPPRLATHEAPPPPAPEGGSGWRTVGWLTTGALAAGAVTFGILGAKASSDLARARGAFPVSSSTLSHDASLVTTYATLADALAGAAVVIGGITLVSALSSSSPRARATMGLASTRLEVLW